MKKHRKPKKKKGKQIEQGRIIKLKPKEK